MNNEREIVNQLNDLLFTESPEKVHDSGYFNYLELIETPIGNYIKFGGHYIWDSENDYREYIAEDEQEPLKGFLIKELLKVKDVIASQVDILLSKEESQ